MQQDTCPVYTCNSRPAEGFSLEQHHEALKDRDQDLQMFVSLGFQKKILKENVAGTACQDEEEVVLLADLIFRAGYLFLHNWKETLLGQGEGCPTLSQTMS